ncbi:MAG: RnfABCDGE type electron transport complex subunit B [Oscillospiraceae bacterium]|nr:RnfABCDGE type electron transport complex subunit B [Oscillospiraceae bacterium]
MFNILMAIIVLGGLGAIFGVVISIVSKLFHVEEDPRLNQIKDILGGGNCGGCGYAGCADFAAGVISGKTSPGACPVGGIEGAAKIAEILGIEAEVGTALVAKVKCSGNRARTKTKYIYEGVDDCISATALAGGDKICAYSCIGLGTCISKCDFGAIFMDDGLARIDKEKCTACGACVKICPKNVIELVPKRTAAFVSCNSKNKGPIVRQICEVGCIACGICVKACPENVITLENNLAKIHRDGCTNCGACIEKCPMNTIVMD